MENDLTTQDAIEILINNNPQDENLVTAQSMAVKALKKDIPLPPARDSKPRYGMGYEYYDYGCPNCNYFLVFEPERHRKHGTERCKYCGQLIDWSEEEPYKSESNSSEKSDWIQVIDKGVIEWQQLPNISKEVSVIM